MSDEKDDDECYCDGRGWYYAECLHGCSCQTEKYCSCEAGRKLMERETKK